MDCDMPALPDGFCRLMEQTAGTESVPLLESLHTAPSVAVRVNKLKSEASPPEVICGCDRVPWAKRGYRLPERPNFTLDPQLHQGRYYVQEPASMFIGAVVEYISSREGEIALRMLDMCAAPGGKTWAAGDALPPGSLVVANEFVPRRASILCENIQKWGAPNVVVTQGDTVYCTQALQGLMDVVVADVPCSGEGMMRKEAEARRQWSPALVEECAALQREIAANGAVALREGGWMIYSTCTFNAIENEANVEWICDNLGFEVEEIPLDESWGLKSNGPGYHFYPHLTASEGLYMCLLRKTGTQRPVKLRNAGYSGIDAASVPWADCSGMALARHDGIVEAIDSDYAPLAIHLRSKSKVLMGGTQLAMEGKKGFEPTHAAAMSVMLRRGFFPELQLDKALALKYLGRHTDGFPACDTRGYVAACYDGYPLGWLKNIGSRYNNLYPQNWRIRMSV